MLRDVADSPSFVVFKSRLSKRDAFPQPEVTGFNSVIAGEKSSALRSRGALGALW